MLPEPVAEFRPTVLIPPFPESCFRVMRGKDLVSHLCGLGIAGSNAHLQGVVRRGEFHEAFALRCGLQPYVSAIDSLSPLIGLYVGVDPRFGLCNHRPLVPLMICNYVMS